MKMKEIRELSTEELKKQIVEEYNSLVDLRFTNELKQLTNTSLLKKTRNTIARMRTELKARELKEQKQL
ncbi:MAG: 50S ribosomal protein L29 [Ignavibacteriaceae bacterium]|nr:50S ribosomal protein L29 [Ignavibacteriaceae bacterium]NUM69810.1 50S ribosomal protein L29 [Ignavibacteriaceae bacterium]